MAVALEGAQGCHWEGMTLALGPAMGHGEAAGGSEEARSLLQGGMERLELRKQEYGL